MLYNNRRLYELQRSMHFAHSNRQSRDDSSSPEWHLSLSGEKGCRLFWLGKQGDDECARARLSPECAVCGSHMVRAPICTRLLCIFERESVCVCANCLCVFYIKNVIISDVDSKKPPRDDICAAARGHITHYQHQRRKGVHCYKWYKKGAFNTYMGGWMDGISTIECEKSIVERAATVISSALAR